MLLFCKIDYFHLAVTRWPLSCHKNTFRHYEWYITKDFGLLLFLKPYWSIFRNIVTFLKSLLCEMNKIFTFLPFYPLKAVAQTAEARIFKSFSQRSFFKFHKMFYPGCGPSIFSQKSFLIYDYSKILVKVTLNLLQNISVSFLWFVISRLVSFRFSFAKQYTPRTRIEAKKSDNLEERSFFPPILMPKNMTS